MRVCLVPSFFLHVSLFLSTAKYYSASAAASTLRAGLGQSMCIGIGGDMIPGTTLKEGLQILVEDDDTEGIAFIGEVGGYGELEAAEFIKSYRAQNKNPK